MNILVADDEPLLVRAIEGRLRKEGYTVQSAADGRQVLEQIAHQAPDLVITDIMMPYASGLEIIAAVRALPGRKVPVIILSSMGQEDVVLEAFRLGADDYITKPFSPNELSVRVKRLLTA
jgi:DNA-binding response OmpR family regulator